MYELHSLVKTVKKRKTVGRGGSRGGTSGKGTKGQNARSGGRVGPIFEGGQMPLHRRLPKRGFNNARFRNEWEIVSLKSLDEIFAENAKIDKAALVESGLISGKGLVKILGGHQLKKKFDVAVDACSKSAIEEITKLGGNVSLLLEE
jgi:large subunit ribosomal protein L15